MIHDTAITCLIPMQSGNEASLLPSHIQDLHFVLATKMGQALAENYTE